MSSCWICFPPCKVWSSGLFREDRSSRAEGWSLQHSTCSTERLEMVCFFLVELFAGLGKPLTYWAGICQCWQQPESAEETCGWILSDIWVGHLRRCGQVLAEQREENLPCCCQRSASCGLKREQQPPGLSAGSRWGPALAPSSSSCTSLLSAASRNPIALDVH